MKPTVSFSNFEALDIRIGRVREVSVAATKKPTYRMTIDLGPEIGTKISCGAYRNYAPGDLVGKQVVCVVNFGSLKMGPEVSEVLVLGVPLESGGTGYLTSAAEVSEGVAVF
jgi:tRNA-binding protein